MGCILVFVILGQSSRKLFLHRVCNTVAASAFCRNIGFFPMRHCGRMLIGLQD